MLHSLRIKTKYAKKKSKTHTNTCTNDIHSKQHTHIYTCVWGILTYTRLLSLSTQRPTLSLNEAQPSTALLDVFSALIPGIGGGKATAVKLLTACSGRTQWHSAVAAATVALAQRQHTEIQLSSGVSGMFFLFCMNFPTNTCMCKCSRIKGRALHTK